MHAHCTFWKCWNSEKYVQILHSNRGVMCFLGSVTSCQIQIKVVESRQPCPITGVATSWQDTSHMDYSSRQTVWNDPCHTTCSSGERHWPSWKEDVIIILIKKFLMQNMPKSLASTKGYLLIKISIQYCQPGCIHTLASLAGHHGVEAKLLCEREDSRSLVTGPPHRC